MIKILAVLIVAVGLGAYYMWPSEKGLPEERAAIQSLLTNARSYDGRSVVVRGTVSGNLSVFQMGGFFLQDGSARIPVLSKSGSPKDGEVIEVRGVFKQAYQFGNTDQAVIFAK